MPVLTKMNNKTGRPAATIREACDAIGPEDSVDDAAAGLRDLVKGEKEILLGRKLAAVRASLKVISALVAALDGDNEAGPARVKAEAYLASVGAWADKPSEEAEKKVDADLLKSDLVTWIMVDGQRVSRADAFGSKLQKACYHAILATLSPKPSDAAGHLFAVAMTTASAIEEAASEPSGWAHSHLVGLIAGEAA